MNLQDITRRQFLKTGSLGIGALALQHLLGAAPKDPLAPKLPPFPARAKRVIYIHLAGSPPNLDLWDYKPLLQKMDGQDCPESFIKGKRFAFTTGTPKLLGSPRTFARHGQCGAWMSDAVPQLSKIVDDLCFVHSMNSDQFNHAPAELFMLTGSPRTGRPSFGSWVTYGLGTENSDLPGFVVLISSGTQPNSGQNAWSSGFLPSVYQGAQCQSKGEPVVYVNDPPGMSRDIRRQSLDAIRKLNEMRLNDFGHEETATRISQFELAYRMQISVPEVMDIGKESPATLERYGAKPGEATLANNCLLARRLVENGVRFVQLFDWGWDFHGTNPKEGLTEGLTTKAASMDQPLAALIQDLKERGLLEDTLVICNGEFGRTPFREGRTSKSKVLGRDHYPDCFTMFMAGGGVKGGYSHGLTDELSFNTIQDQVHVHDLQATVLQLLGHDHERLTYRFQGRDFRLTDVHGKVVKALMA